MPTPPPPPAWQEVQTQSKGRCLVATRALQPGTDVLVHHADVWALDASERSSRCAFCLRVRLSHHLHPCDACEVFFYCSDQCQGEDFLEHKLECTGLRNAPVEIGPTMLMTARVVRRIIVEGASVENPRKRPFQRAIKKLVHHLDKTPPARIIEFQRMADIVVALVCSPPASPQMGGILTLLGGNAFVRKLFARISCNAFTITDPDFHVAGSGLFLGVVAANHSCDPNCFQMFDGPSIRLRALRPIAPGEELTIGYIDLSELRSERQKILRESYGFLCTCSRCSSLEELWSDTRVRAWACPRRAQGCVGACVEEGRGAALYRAWRASKDGNLVGALDKEVRERVCEACGARLSVKEVEERMAAIRGGEALEVEAETKAKRFEVDAMRTALAACERSHAYYSPLFVPYVSIHTYSNLENIEKLCLDLKEMGLLLTYGSLKIACVEAITPRHSPVPAHLYAQLGKAAWCFGYAGTALTYLTTAVRRLEVYEPENQFAREVRRLLKEVQQATGRKK